MIYIKTDMHTQRNECISVYLNNIHLPIYLSGRYTCPMIDMHLFTCVCMSVYLNMYWVNMNQINKTLAQIRNGKKSQFLCCL